MKNMKSKLFLVLFLVSPFLKGGPLSGQLYSVQGQFYTLPQDLTTENIRSVLDQIGELGKNGEDITEEEDTMIIALREDGMFLSTLKDYMENPADKDLASDLEQWAECKADYYDFLQQAIEKNPKNEALQSINLNFPTWWTGYALPTTE